MFRGASYHKSDVDPEDDNLLHLTIKKKKQKVYGPRLKRIMNFVLIVLRDLKERMDKGGLKVIWLVIWQDYKKGLHKRENRKLKICKGKQNILKVTVEIN